MRLLRRLLALALAIAVILVFYVFAIMMDKETALTEQQFTVEAVVLPLGDMQPLDSDDALALVTAFGVALPLPEGLVKGRVENTSHQGYAARRVRLEGSQARLTGIRPASAASAILPRQAAFTALDKALLGFPLLQARLEGRSLYALVTPQAAFLIEPLQGDQPGAFTQLEPAP
ncbi:MAG: hypothetical protein GXY84_05965 [Clostridiales bacterium]|nr:hypothetical protein [Clostridiales bacterium]